MSGPVRILPPISGAADSGGSGACPCQGPSCGAPPGSIFGRHPRPPVHACPRTSRALIWHSPCAAAFEVTSGRGWHGGAGVHEPPRCCLPSWRGASFARDNQAARSRASHSVLREERTGAARIGPRQGAAGDGHLAPRRTARVKEGNASSTGRVGTPGCLRRLERTVPGIQAGVALGSAGIPGLTESLPVTGTSLRRAIASHRGGGQQGRGGSSASHRPFDSTRIRRRTRSNRRAPPAHAGPNRCCGPP
jgi:hypothetical protein